jgi:L-fuconolactonase
MIDSHVHFWRYQASAFPWINADMAVLQHDFLPDDYFAASGEQVTGMVAVQARTSWAENQFLLDLAQAEPRVAMCIRNWNGRNPCHCSKAFAI